MAAPTEASRFWTTGGAGDGASTYTRDNLAEAFRNAFLGDFTTQGPFSGLAVSGATSPMTLAVGSACVYGFFYFCTVAGDLTKTTPAVGTTGIRIVLRADWTAQTVRAVVLASADGVAAIPAVTQSAGSTWEISLATGTITTGGVITLTDVRVFAVGGASAAAVSVLGRSAGTIGAMAPIIAGDDGNVLRRSGTTVGFGAIATAGITDLAVTTGKLAADSVDDTVAGARVPQFYRRQGGSATDWSIVGTTDRTPTSVRMQAGRATATFSGETSDTVTITFPAAFSQPPIGFATSDSTGSSGTKCYAAIGSVTATTMAVVIHPRDGGTLSETVAFSWQAIGPE